MKRLFCVLLCVVLFSGCTLPQPTTPTHPHTSPTDTRPVHNDAWAYDCLSAAQQENYDAVYTAVADGFATDSVVTLSHHGEQGEEVNDTSAGIAVTLPHPLSTQEEVSQLYDAFMQDNPAFFHVGSVYGYTGRQHGDEQRFTALNLTYTMTAEERVKAREQLEEKAREIVGTVTATDTPYDIERKLHDALSATCTYHRTAAENREPLKSFPSAFTAYGALVEGEAVCEGYARAMQYLLQSAGIPATVVSGRDTDDNAHMWNAVRLGDEMYYLDVTWDDSTEPMTYSYFNLNTEEMMRCYRVDSGMLGLENSTATVQNFYHRDGKYLDTLRLEEIASVIAEIVAEDGTAHLRFSEAAFSNALLFVRSSSWLVETVNAFLPETAEPIPALTVVCDEKQRTVTICKKIS